MIDFAHRRDRDRAEVFEETAARQRIGRPTIVEKDFWVCWVLAQLYGVDGPADAAKSDPALLFKGGTSLSKVFGLIDRFSEDVDLTVAWAALGPDIANPNDQDISGKERKRRIDAIGFKCTEYVAGPITDFLTPRIASVGGSLQIDEADRQTIDLQYPPALPKTEYAGGRYVTAAIRLEFGARGELWPAEHGLVTPYAAQEFPSLFSAPVTRVWALSPKRTFWEKATILHNIANRGKVGGSERQSRHYADLARIAGTPIGIAAAKDIQLLLDVARHKSNYFPAPAAHYELARPPTLQLIPPAKVLADLAKDYDRMREMFTTEPPSFAEIIDQITALQDRINTTIPNTV